MALVAAVLGVAVYLVEIRGAAEREAAEEVADRLLRFETDEVIGVTIDRADESIVLSKSDDEWRITAPYELAADATAVTTIVNRLQSADHDRVVEEEPEELARFGLEDPGLTVTLQLASGESRALQFGDGTPVGFNVFVKRPDDAPVMTAASSLEDAVDKTLFDLRNRSILSFTEDDVSRVEIESDALTATVEREPDAGDGIDRWTLSAPLQAAADAETISSLLNGLRTDNALAFASEEPSEEQLAEFGLDAPVASIRVWTAEDAAHTLQLGGSAEDPAGRYARRLGADAVMVVPETLVTDLPESVDALRNRTVVDFARDRVDAIELTVADAPTVRLEKDGVDWRITEPSALEADASTVAALLTGALNLRAREFPEGTSGDARFGMGSPHAEVSFALESMPGAEGDEPGTEGEDPGTAGADPDPETESEAGGSAATEMVTLTVGAATEVEPEGGDTPDAAGAEGEAPPPLEPVAARYVAVSGRPAVLTVEESDLDDVLVDLFTLRSKTLVSFAQSELTRLQVSTPLATRELVKNEDGAWTLDGNPLDDTTPVDDMLWRLNYLDMRAIVVEGDDAAGADLAAYGLADPALRVRAWVGDEMVADVGIGGDVAESDLQEPPALAAQSQTYATVGDTPGVFRIDAALRDALQTLVDAVS